MRNRKTTVTPTVATNVFETQLRRASRLHNPEDVLGKTLIAVAEILAPMVRYRR